MRNLLLIAFLALIFVPFASAQNQETPNLMPLPSNIQFQSGRLVIDTSFSTAITGHNEERLQRALTRMTKTLARQTGLNLSVAEGKADGATLVIHTDHASDEVQSVGEDESYALVVTAEGAKLNAANPLGILRGLQTFVQLVELTPTGYSVPAVTIKDQPRFPWRGLMIDVSRHWMPIEVIKRNLDAMEAVKLNTFHWHLSDNQGVRVESKRYPALQQLGSDSHYYPQEEIKDILAYARDRGIRVIPEFDLPGHSTAFFVGYPELASGPGPYSIEREYGIFDPAFDPTKESTYKFLDGFIGEMAGLFPDAYFHIGGDEVNGKEWDRNPKIQEYMKAHGIKNNAELQANFTKRLQEIVAEHHKIMVGWDEILSPDIPKSIVIQSWRGSDSLAAAAKQGYRGLLSYGYYLDLFQPASFHYLNEPLSGKAADLNEQEKKMILGGEGCMWSELVTPDSIDSRIWPRMAAIAERLWSPQNTRDVRSMYARMETESMRLEWLGLKHRSYYRPMLERLVASNDILALKTLADVVQAPQEYARGEYHLAQTGHEYRSTESYNRLVDATKPESLTAVEFEFMVDDLLAKKASPTEVEKMREMLVAWRDNDAKLQPQLQSSFLLKEAIPLSQSLSVIAKAGLMALEDVRNGRKAAPETLARQMAAINMGKKPQGELLVSIAPAVERLVQAAAGMRD